MRPLGFSRGPALRQVQRQTQTLAMTPQLRQAIQLLQLSNLELDTWLEDALETNPLLARDDGVAEGAGAEAGAGEREEKPRADAHEASPADPAPLDFGAEPGYEAPESFGGVRWSLLPMPTFLSAERARRSISPEGVPTTLSARAMFSYTVLCGSSL